MIKVLFGGEDYCVWYKKHKVIDPIEAPEFNISEFDTFDAEALSYLRTFPMMADRKVGVFNISDLKELDNDLFKSYLANPDDFCDVFILPKSVDKRTKFYKELDKKGFVEECKKLGTNDELQKMVFFFLKPYSARITKDACDELLRRVNYTNMPTVTLWTLKGIVENLAQSSVEIDKSLVEALVEENEEENVFKLIKLLNRGDLPAIRSQEDVIMREQGSTIGALSALLREFRIGYKKIALNKTPKEIGVNFITISDEPKEYLYRGIKVITSVIEDIKQGRLKPDRAITLACEKLLTKDA